jgi:membrane dipeptidase
MLAFHSRFIPAGNGSEHALDQIAMLHCEMEESKGLFFLCRNASEVRKTVEEGRTALLLSFEGAEPLGNDLLLLRSFYELGVRFVGLTWSRRNYAADGCHFQPVPEGTPGGLTAFGVQLLEEAGGWEWWWTSAI